MVGHAGFHGPPGVNGPEKSGAVELGYTIFPDFRGRGLATEAARALMDWAEETHGIVHFIASIAPTNEPSLASSASSDSSNGRAVGRGGRLELVFELVR